MRLQKYMAKCGIASRRRSEEIILEGRVKVNNKVVKELGIKIDPEIDEIEVDKKKIAFEKKLIYIILNKPVGYISTVKDQFDRPTVLDLVSDIDERLYPVGRLDFDTSGLLLLTNDGDLTYKITHPSHEINKTYIAKINGIPTEDELNSFRSGLKIENYTTSKASITILKKYKDSCDVKIIIHEGKNRQVRKMCATINHPVLNLKRISIGKIDLENIKSGNWRYMTESEVNYLNSI